MIIHCKSSRLRQRRTAFDESGRLRGVAVHEEREKGYLLKNSAALQL